MVDGSVRGREHVVSIAQGWLGVRYCFISGHLRLESLDICRTFGDELQTCLGMCGPTDDGCDSIIIGFMSSFISEVGE
jgi:hypothetical protein